MSEPPGISDHFSGQARHYAAFRPSYPEALSAFLASIAPDRGLAWDCGTGSGQAARGIAPHFERVIATDASASQIEQAAPHPGVTFGVAPAHASGLADRSVALVTAAQAFHWFDPESFHREVRRVLMPDGVIAVWAYALATIEPGIDTVIEAFYRDRVGRYWPPERRHIENGYRELPFPYERVKTPDWRMRADLDRDAFVGYLETWSAVARARAEGVDPIPGLVRELEIVWPDRRAPRAVTWPLTVLVGRLRLS